MESLQTHFEKLIEGLNDRSKDILRRRFGIEGKRPSTLEEIGGLYRITRERVRQIVRSAIKEAKTHGKERLQIVQAVVEKAIAERSGIISEQDLKAVLGKNNIKETAALLFFLEHPMESIRIFPETATMKASYALKDFNESAWKSMIQTVIDMLKNEKEAISEKDMLKKYAHNIHKIYDEKALFDFIAVSKEVKSNTFGKFGLSFWKDISPKGTRERAYLTLKTKGKPLHFRDIAKLIDQYGLSKVTGKGVLKKTHFQTVHNELIKDNRFVLVGRGTYALSEWGYAKGTVREVIEQVLRENGKKPMNRDILIENVLALRSVKRSTVVINLNTFFAKVGKDAYTLS